MGLLRTRSLACGLVLLSFLSRETRADFLILKSGKAFRGTLERQADGSLATSETKNAYDPKKVARTSTAKTAEEVIRTWCAELEGKTDLESNQAYLSLAKFCIGQGKYKEAQAFCTAWAGPRGWTVSMSKYYFVLSNARKKKRVDEITVRLDAIVGQYLKDFKLGRKLKRDFVVRVFGTEEEFDEYARARGNSGSTAFYCPEMGELVLWDMSAVSKNLTFECVYHEANHQYIDEYYVDHSTKHMWFSEGLATYYESVKIKYGRVLDVGKKHHDYRANLKAARSTRNLVPLAKFLSMGTKDFYVDDADESERNYAQAWGVVYFFMKTRDPGPRKFFETYKKVLRETKDDPRALAEALKRMDATALEKAWTAFVKKL
ncbi:MAG: DUF1570 domain-containing protein [Planctomycetota bacterium]|jgi:hypothetical protein